ncbi:MAG: hypothetical protein ACYC0V_13060, partial [Armatimonadota bacterium]
MFYPYKTDIKRIYSRVMHLILMMVFAFSLTISIQNTVLAASKMKPEEEIKIGADAAVEVAKESKLIDDAAMNARVQAIGSAVASVANVKHVKA